MKLITLGKTEDSYTVKASKSYKIAGQTIRTITEEYICPLNKNEWYNIQGKKVSYKKRKYLNSWLKDHKKFIENG